MENRYCRIEHMDEPYMTIIGSRLYGTSHSKSDLDLCLVLPTHHGEEQKRIGNIDFTLIGFAQFANKVRSGIPRALDALFAKPASSLPRNSEDSSPRSTFHKPLRCTNAQQRLAS